MPGSSQLASDSAMYIDGSDWKMPFAGVGSRSMSSKRYSLAPVCWLMGMPRSSMADHKGSYTSSQYGASSTSDG